jgi:hypothetical protein
MVTVQRSIEINVPVHTLYSKITYFEAYPRFMHDVESVQQLDDIHLHWITRMSDQPVEWNAIITERVPNHCIAWHNTTGPTNAGKLELQPTGPGESRLTLTLNAEAGQEQDSSTNDGVPEISQKVWEDLIRLKDFVESDGAALNALDRRGAQTVQGSQGWQSVALPYVAGSESGTGEANDSLAAYLQTDVLQQMNPLQSDDAFSKAVTDEVFGEQFPSMEEEVNLNQQPLAMRHLGELPQDTSVELNGGIPTSDAIGNALQQRQGDGEDEEI